MPKAKQFANKYAVVCVLSVLVTTSAYAQKHTTAKKPQQSTLQKTHSMNTNEILPASIRHKSLTVEQLKRAEHIRQVLREPMPTSDKEWLDGFQRDQDPDQELKIWESMVHAYLAFCASKNLSLQAKQDVLNVTLLRSDMPEGKVLKEVKLQVLTIQDAKEIMRQYKDPPTPITISHSKS